MKNMSRYCEIRRWYRHKLVETTAKSLSRNGFETHIAEDAREAKRLVLQLIPSGSTVGIGGSVTIRELGIIEELERQGYRVVHHWVKASPEDLDELRRRELTADVFLCSANAITIDGKIVAIDGVGNRVAAMSFGPRMVILVIGVNKIVRNLEEALSRAKNVAAIMNWRRLGLQTPCVETGYCIECDAPSRGCRITLILDRRPSRTEYHVILVKEELGF